MFDNIIMTWKMFGIEKKKTNIDNKMKNSEHFQQDEGAERRKKSLNI